MRLQHRIWEPWANLGPGNRATIAAQKNYEFKNNTYQRMHAEISACRSWRRSNLETPRCGAALDMAQLHHRSWTRAPCAFSQSLWAVRGRRSDGPLQRHWRWLGRGPSDGDVGAPSGTASLLFRIGRFDGRAMAWQATFIGPWCRSEL